MVVKFRNLFKAGFIDYSMSLEGFEFAPVNNVPSFVVCDSPVSTNQVSYIGVDAYRPIEQAPVRVGHSVGEYIGSTLMFSVGAVAMIYKFSKRDKVFQRMCADRIANQAQ